MYFVPALLGGYILAFGAWVWALAVGLRRSRSMRDRLSSAALLQLSAGGAALGVGLAFDVVGPAFLVAAFVIPGASAAWAWRRTAFTAWWRHPGW